MSSSRPSGAPNIQEIDTIEEGVVRCPVNLFSGFIIWPPAGAGGRTGRGFGGGRSGMQIDERVVNGVTILDLKGKMTLGEGDELLKDKINSLIQQDRKKLLLNLEGVPYIDSAGLGEIVRTYTTVSRQGGKLKLLNLTKRIQDLLAITKLLTVFETYESEPEAIKSF